MLMTNCLVLSTADCWWTYNYYKTLYFCCLLICFDYKRDWGYRGGSPTSVQA